MKPRLRLLPLSVVALLWLATPLSAEDVNQPPEITPGVMRGISEHGFATLGVTASDPEGDTLTYSWSIPTDPTGNAFFRLPDGSESATLEGRTTARLGLVRGPNFPNPSFVGQTIEVRVDVSDSTNTSSFTFPVPVNAVNHPPEIILDTSQLGTLTNPRLEGQGFSVDARQSRDQDGDFVNFFWRIVGLSGGGPCAGSNALVLHLKETPTPAMVVPKMRALPQSPAKVSIEYIVEDGLYTLSKVLPGYMASPNGCQTTPPPGDGNDPPVVSAAVSVPHARFGETVTLTGAAEDPGDTLTFSWLQLSTTGVPQVAIARRAERVATFVAPDVPGFYSFRFTATDSANQSRSADVAVQISQSGGGGGGETPPTSGEPSGTAAGQTSCSGFASQGDNKPAEAHVPANYMIVGGNRAQITASMGRDPDDTVVVVSGVSVAGQVFYQWKVLAGNQVVGDSSLEGADAKTVSFATPTVSTEENVQLEVFVKDGLGCGTRYPVAVVVQPPADTNKPPSLSLQYQVQQTGDQGVDTPEVSVETPADILIEAAAADPDGDDVQYDWTMEPNLAGVSLNSGGPARTLKAEGGVEGQVTISVTVSDGKGGSDSRSIRFQFLAPEEPDDKPVLAQAAVYSDGETVDGPVAPGVVLTLSGADTSVAEGSAEENAGLTFSWEQITASPAAFARNMDRRDAQVIVEEVEAVSTLTFRLTARNGNAVDTAEVSFTVDPSLREEEAPEEEAGDLYFAQVGFGPVEDLRFQTLLILDNLTSDSADQVQIDFFDSDGSPLQLDYVDTDGGQPEVRNWLSETALTIPARTSRVLEFRAPEGAGLTVGWASVSSATRLRGSVRFQLVDRSGTFLSDVGISSSLRGSKFQSAFRSRDEIAFAVSNPESEPIEIRVNITDRLQGWHAEKTVELAAGSHSAVFVRDFFGFLDNLPEEGTIELEVVGSGTMIPTLLITRDRLAVSSQSLAPVE